MEEFSVHIVMMRLGLVLLCLGVAVAQAAEGVPPAQQPEQPFAPPKQLHIQVRAASVRIHDDIAVTVTDDAGTSPTDVAVELAVKSAALTKRLALSEGVWTIAARELVAAAGARRFNATFRVVAEDGSAGKYLLPLPQRLALRVVATAVYGDATIAVTDTDAKRSSSSSSSGSGSSKSSKTVIAYPKAVDAPISVGAGQTLSISFSVQAAAAEGAGAGAGAGAGGPLPLVPPPHQAFVRLTHAHTGQHTYFVAAPDAAGSKAGVLSWSVDVSDRRALAGATAAGAYAVALLLGDATIANSAVWHLATLHLAPPPAAATPQPPLYTTPLLHASDIALQPLPEIRHVFRPEEPRPPAAASAAATLVIAAAFLAWLGYSVRRIRGSAALPAAVQLWALLFFAVFAAILLLYTAFWVQLSMATTLQVLALLAIPMLAALRQLLAALHSSSSSSSKEHVN